MRAQPSPDGKIDPLHAPRTPRRVDDARRRRRGALARARRARGGNVNWRVTPNGIYYVGATADQPVIRRAPLTGGPGVDVAWIGNYSWPGFAVTPDGTRDLRALGSPRQQHHGDGSLDVALARFMLSCCR